MVGRPDHPRSRGVYRACATDDDACTGSSPLARGLLCGHIPLLVHGGIIPARAGFTGGPDGATDGGRDHPRSRGVYNPAREGRGFQQGSSPLARGLLPVSIMNSSKRRIIPARAGFTSSDFQILNMILDHPRSRGVYSSPILA